MDLFLLLAAAAAALLMLAAAVGLISLGNSAFNVRLAGRADGQAERFDVGRLRPGVASALNRLGAIAGRGALDGDERAPVRDKLVRAGFYSAHAVEMFYGVRAIGALGLATLGLLGGLIVHASNPLLLLLGTAVGAALGLFLPNLWLARRIAARERAMKIGLPDAVDLIVVCLEAGGALAGAMQRVEAEFREAHPVLSEQLRIVLMHMQAGSSRAAALQALAARMRVDEIRALVTLLIQSEALGASMAHTMRVFAQEMRNSRYLEAERRAAELPVKMTLPLVLFIFPALSTVIFVPIALRFMRVLFTH